MIRQKDPEIRKNEIIQASEELFIEKGYENTTVEGILQRTGLSKGGFYHHFKSKNDVFIAIIDRITNETVKAAEEIAEMDDIDALQKIQLFSEMQFHMKMPKTKIIQVFFRERDINPHFHKHNVMMWEKYVPVFVKIVKQGISKGSMKVEFPEETVKLLFRMIASLYDFEEGLIEDEEKMKRHIAALEDIFTKSLGIETRGIHLVKSELLSALSRLSRE
ncbi:TetR/AcrR family transcriptional regulator [Paenibacillus zanthoxyli]|uniref:TetR/AcrR family transcriptional regulator n=1 Tax=Paenibacillus zanthoxyli TaxID=369399 RepID=UPI00046F723B|nr:TetR/AcrR family transcriptional regulator [Paenibacillus zanthoxyli]